MTTTANEILELNSDELDGVNGGFCLSSLVTLVGGGVPPQVKELEKTQTPVNWPYLQL